MSAAVQEQGSERALHLRWLGVAALEITSSGEVLLVDPYISRITWREQLIGPIEPDRDMVRQRITQCNHILVTHSHFDHLLDAPVVARETGATVYGSPNTCELLQILGVPEEQTVCIDEGDELRLGAFQVKVKRGEHIDLPGFRPGPLSRGLKPPLRARQYRMDTMLNYRIDIDGLRLLVELGVPGWGARADVLFTAPFQDESRYRDLLHKAQPRLVVPVHWDDMWQPLNDSMPPILKPPQLEWPPIERVDVDALVETIHRLWPQAGVLVPRPLATYDLRELCGSADQAQ